MIRNLGDHSANERTFLAWVRTSVAIMAFGFLLEKFDLFLAIAAQSLSVPMHLPDRRFGYIVGLILIILGTIMIAIATVRFRRTAKAIDSAATVPLLGERIDVALACLLILLGVSMFLYLAQALLSGL